MSPSLGGPIRRPRPLRPNAERPSSGPLTVIIETYSVNVDDEGVWITLTSLPNTLAYIYFRFDGSTIKPTFLPETGEWPTSAGLLWSLPFSSYSAVIDMLRNEGPVSVVIDQMADPLKVRLATRAEPTGEGE